MVTVVIGKGVSNSDIFFIEFEFLNVERFMLGSE